MSNDSSVRSMAGVSFIPQRQTYGGQRTGFADDLFEVDHSFVGRDEVTLSPAGELSAKLPALGLFGVQPRDDGNIHLEDIRSAYRHRMASFQSNLSKRLREADVDRSIPFSLQAGYDGQITVAGDHPDREAIEQIFAENPRLADRFKAISSTGSFLRAADRSLEFQAAYAKDPAQAVAMFSDLFDNRDSIFALEVTEQSMREVFID